MLWMAKSIKALLMRPSKCLIEVRLTRIKYRERNLLKFSNDLHCIMDFEKRKEGMKYGKIDVKILYLRPIFKKGKMK